MTRDNYCVRHEHADADTERRKAYFNGTLTHQEYYMGIAKEMGEEALRCVVLTIASPEHLRAMSALDEHLNNIPLFKWDNRHASVTHIAHLAGYRVWTLSDTVCVLKAVAREVAKS